MKHLSTFFAAAALILGYFIDASNATATTPLDEFEYPDFVFNETTIPPAPVISGKPTIAPLKAKSFNFFLQNNYDNWPQFLYPIYMSNMWGLLGLYWIMAAGIIFSMFFFCYPFHLTELTMINKEVARNKAKTAMFLTASSNKKKGSKGSIKEGGGSRRQKKKKGSTMRK